jgi:hypothetical protein
MSVKLLSLLVLRSACLFWLVYNLFSDAVGDRFRGIAQIFDPGN